MSSTNKNPYGLRNGRIISVEDLNPISEFGLKCNCICPSCGDPLVARIRGTKKEKHFAHKSGADCGKAYESALHRLAKQVIDEGAEISLPPLESSYACINGYIVIDGIIKFPSYYSMAKPIIPDKGETVVEKDMGAFRPDISIKHNGIELFIEIQVTHPVDDEKKKRIQEKKISCIEVDFSYYKNEILDESDIRDALAGKDNNVEIRWIYNKIIEEQNAIIQNNLETSFIIDSYKDKPRQETALSEIGFMHEIVANHDKILNCPQRKHFDGISFYAKKNECANCKSFSGFLYKINSETPNSILCSNGDNNVKVYPENAARWLISLAKKRRIPFTREECEELIEFNFEKLGLLSNHSYVKNAKEQAVKIILTRFEEKKREHNYKAICEIITLSINSLIYWANSSFEVWSRFAYKKILTDIPEYLFETVSLKEVDSAIYNKAKNTWDVHCKEGERLYKIDEKFHSIINYYISKPINKNELQKDWLYRVTSDLLKEGGGTFKYFIPYPHVTYYIKEISILPLLEKISKDNFDSKPANPM